MLNRRHLLYALASAPLLASAAGRLAPKPGTLLAAWEQGGDYFAGDALHPERGIRLPARGHGLLVDRRRPGTAIVMARRPGDWLLRIDWQRGRLLQQVDASLDRYFFGHGCFSADGHSLFTSECDVATSQGVIARRDPRTLKVLAEFPSGGIGPHEILMLADGSLLVANGGIATLPETGRRKLNLDTMQPSLVRLDAGSGKVLAEYTLDDSKLSIRHLAQSADGTVGVALQDESGPTPAKPLLALLRDGQLQLAPTSPALAVRMAGYAASVAALGDYFAISCPKGGVVAIWRSTGEWVGQYELAGAAGLVAVDGHWQASSEAGVLARLAPAATLMEQHVARGIRWDNHLVWAD